MTVADIEPEIADGCAQFGSCFSPKVVVLIVATSAKRIKLNEPDFAAFF